MRFSLSFEAIGSNSLTNRRPRMKPSFDQVLRLIVCVAGIVFFGVGIWMVQKGISAQGVIDIKSEVLSGHLETGSAGLFVMFFSFFLIVLSFLLKHPSTAKSEFPQKKPSRIPAMLTLSIFLRMVAIGSFWLSTYVQNTSQSMMLMSLYFISLTSALPLSHSTYKRWNEEMDEKRN